MPDTRWCAAVRVRGVASSVHYRLQPSIDDDYSDESGALHHRMIIMQSNSRLPIRPTIVASFFLVACIGAGQFMRGAPRAATPAPASVKVLNAWSRATAPGASVGVAYFEIVNSGAADALTAMESPVAERVEMHSTSMNGAVMQMRPVASVPVPAGARIAFEPGGLHAMLIDLKQPLQQDQRFPLTLLFEHAGRVRVEVLVQGL